MHIFANFRNPVSDPYLLYIKEKYNDKPFTIWHEKFPDNVKQLEENPYNFLFLAEPNELFGLHNIAVSNYNLFTGILTWSEVVLNNCPNGIKLTFNGRVLDKDYIESIKDKPKLFEVSFLSGRTNYIEGHHLRQRILLLDDQIKIPKKWFEVLNDYDHSINVRPGYTSYSKDLSHIPKGVDIVGYGKRVLYNSMFNVVVESCWQNNWYNKIGDSFLTKCIPVYWGCPNLSEMGYDERGIIRFKNENELINILNSLTPEVYEQMKPYIDYNYEVAKLDEEEDKVTQFFDEFIKINDIK